MCGPDRVDTTMLHVVLLRPLIPWNTGAIGRTCLSFGARLHLVGPLGFSLEESKVKRAGLDYWQHVDLRQYKDWEEFEKEALPKMPNRYFISKFGQQSLTHTTFAKSLEEDVTLIFGSESKGVYSLLGDEKLKNEKVVNIPMLNPHRTFDTPSFNLATSVGMLLWEAWRQKELLRELQHSK